MQFSKPIAVPSPAKKVEMVGLLLENNMIELNLANADSGSSIKGAPYFDEKEFSGGPVGRLLSGEEPDVDPATAR